MTHRIADWDDTTVTVTPPVMKAFNPDQPRGEHGRWEPGDPMPPIRPEDIDDPEGRAAWKRQMASVGEWERAVQEGPRPGEFLHSESPGYVGHIVPPAQVPQDIRARVAAVATRDGWDPKVVQYIDHAPYALIGDGGGLVNGTYVHKTGKINMYLDTGVSDEVLTHEGFHLREAVVMDEAQHERDKAITAGDLSKANANEFFGPLKPGTERKYPTYAMLSKYMGTDGAREQLIREDGITGYSRSTWTMQDSPVRSVSETLAEYARVTTYPHTTERALRGWTPERSPHLAGLYNGITSAYTRITRGAH